MLKELTFTNFMITFPRRWAPTLDCLENLCSMKSLHNKLSYIVPIKDVTIFFLHFQKRQTKETVLTFLEKLIENFNIADVYCPSLNIPKKKFDLPVRCMMNLSTTKEQVSIERELQSLRIRNNCDKHYNEHLILLSQKNSFFSYQELQEKLANKNLLNTIGKQTEILAEQK